MTEPRLTVEQQLDLDARIESEVQRETRGLRSRVDTLSSEKRELEQMLGLYSRLSTEPIAPPAWTVSKTSRAGTHEGIIVAQLTDTHWDEIVKAEEVLGLNAYNREIAQTRYRTWGEKVVTLPSEYMTGVEIAGLSVFATGDLFTGDIHAELKESNEDKLYASVIHWTEQTISVLDLLEAEYKNVTLSAVVGNHGRSTLKPVFKGRAHSNIEWLFWRVIQARMKDRGSNIVFNVSDAMDLNVPIYGRNHLLTHGDQFHGGTGIAGAYSPLSLGQHRKSVRQLAAGIPMETMVMGHFHQLINLPGLEVGGSVKGYDEYAFGLNLRPEEAKQNMWLTTPEHGATIHMPVLLQDGVREGWQKAA